MHFQTVHILVLVFSLAASLFVLIAATRYAMWSRPLTNGSSSWLGLCVYVGFVPLTSLLYTITHLALLHFRKIPSFSPSAIAARAASSPGSKPPSPKALLTLLLFTSAFSLAWLAQATLCTACEMAPIASGRQGVVPGWCPQSRFREKTPPQSTSSPSSNDSADRAAMLASVALAKDVINWVIFVAGLCMVECCRRGWKAAQVLEAESDRQGILRGYDPGMGGAAKWSGGNAELTGYGNTKGYDANRPGPTTTTYEFETYRANTNPNTVRFADPELEVPRTSTRDKKNSWMAVRGVQDVRVNLRVPGVSYDTRI